MNRKGERTVILGTRRSTATRGRGNVKEGGREYSSPPGETKEGSPRWSGLGREVGGGGRSAHHPKGQRVAGPGGGVGVGGFAPRAEARGFQALEVGQPGLEDLKKVGGQRGTARPGRDAGPPGRQRHSAPAAAAVRSGPQAAGAEAEGRTHRETGAGGGVCEGKALEASGRACSAPGRSRTW